MATHKIYFVRSTKKFIKIGRTTTSLEARRSTMQVGNPIILKWYGYLECSCDASPQSHKCPTENKLHVCFKDLRVHKDNQRSEWFHTYKRLLEHIDKLKSDNKLYYDDGKKFNGEWVDGFGPRSSQ